jgi:ligand-binding sensor domain-containing protein
MKLSYIFIVVLLILQIEVSAQNPLWKNYVSSSIPQDIFIDNENVWIATWGSGLIRMNKQTQICDFFQKDNSGIPSMFISSVTKDYSGSIWIGLNTGPALENGGVAKFDGTSWIHYDTSNSNILDNVVRNVFVAKDNSVWIGTDDGIAHFDGTNWIPYNNKNGFPGSWIGDIVEDQSGKLYFSTADSGIAIYNSGTWSSYKTTNSGLISNSVYGLKIDKNGHLLIGSQGYFQRFDGANWITYDSVTTGFNLSAIFKIDVDNSNNYWLGYTGVNRSASLLKYDGTSWKSYSDKAIYTLKVDKSNNDLYVSNPLIYENGKQYIDMDSSLRKFDGNSWATIPVSRAKVFPYIWICAGETGNDIWAWGESYLSHIKDGHVDSFYYKDSIGGGSNGRQSEKPILMDSSGNIWIGKYDALQKINPSTHQVITYNNQNSQLPNYSVTTLSIDKNQNLWMGLNGGGLVKYDGSNFTQILSKLNGYGFAPSALEFDSKGNLWMGTMWFGLVKVDSLSNHSYFNPVSSPYIFVYGVAVDKYDNVWFTIEDTLYKYSQTLNNYSSYKIPGYWAMRVEDMRIDKNNNVWLATGGGGLLKFDGTSWISYTSLNSGLSCNEALNLVITKDDFIYVATEGGGVSRLDLSSDTCRNSEDDFYAVQSGDTIQFYSLHNNLTNISHPVSWQFSDSSTSNSYSPKIKALLGTDSIWAKMILTDNSGCEHTVAKKVKLYPIADVVTSLPKPATNNTLPISLFPNPAKEIMLVSTRGYEGSRLTIYTSQGQLVKEQLITGQQAEINLSNLPPALYLFQVQNGDKISTGKFVKE